MSPGTATAKTATHAPSSTLVLARSTCRPGCAAKRVISLARKSDDLYAETYARYRLGYALVYTGRSAEAEHQARSNLAQAERLGDQGLLEDALYVNAALAQLRGNWIAAREFSDRGLELAPYNLNLLHPRVLLELELGEVDNGRAYLATMQRASLYAGPYPIREDLQMLLMKQAAFLGLATHEPAFESNPSEQPTTPTAAGLRAAGHALTAIQEANVAEAAIAMRSLKPLRARLSLHCC